jgi:hypothetical protein
MVQPTRRELILCGASAVGLAGLGAGADSSVAVATGDEAAELQSIVVVEQLSAFAYAHLLATPALSAASASVLRSFLAHEREHARLISDQLERLGVSPPPVPTDPAAVGHQLAGLQVPGNLQRVRSEGDALHYLIGVETLAEGTYYSAMSRLSQSRLLVLAAQIMSCEAQHWSALSGLLHAGDVHRAVPYPVVLG